jgi:hypothetical protein
MSGTVKRTPPHPMSKEDKAHRKPWHRQVRHAAKLAVRQGEEPERIKRTSGWLTW